VYIINRDENEHFEIFAGVASRLAYANFFGRPTPSSAPTPSRDLTLPKVESLCDKSCSDIVGVSPEM
jgi:hypothetical protein